MREQKKKLRSAQRRLAAAKRDNTYTRIMNLNERNDKQWCPIPFPFLFTFTFRAELFSSFNHYIRKFSNYIINVLGFIIFCLYYLGYWTFEREFTNLSTHDPIIVTVACKLQRIDINSQRHENIRVTGIGVVSFVSCQSMLGRAKFFLLLSHIFVICTFPIVYVTFLLPFPVVKFSLFHDCRHIRCPLP
jgi:hypothetical protein